MSELRTEASLEDNISPSFQKMDSYANSLINTFQTLEDKINNIAETFENMSNSNHLVANTMNSMNTTIEDEEAELERLDAIVEQALNRTEDMSGGYLDAAHQAEKLDEAVSNIRLG